MCAFSSVGAGAAEGCRCCSSVGRAACLRARAWALVPPQGVLGSLGAGALQSAAAVCA